METYTELHPIRSLSVRIFVGILIALSVMVISAYVYMGRLNTPPESFPLDADIVIEEGGTINSVAVGLANAGVVQSAFYLYILLNTVYKDTYIQAGTYRFPTPMTARDVARAITQGEHQSPLLRVMFPEGFRASDFYSFIPSMTPTLSIESLIAYEGFLFPDTYFISPDATDEDIRTIMSNTFREKIAPYAERIRVSGMSEKEIIVFASIIEREAKDTESKHMVAGILHNRLKRDMPLQVDATLDYVLNKESSELTLDDLEIDSPFNTYNNTGLPPTPISNPGQDAIEAVLSPTESDYLYYLTAPDGTFHYAKTFEEHKQNKARYLR